MTEYVSCWYSGWPVRSRDMTLHKRSTPVQHPSYFSSRQLSLEPLKPYLSSRASNDRERFLRVTRVDNHFPEKIIMIEWRIPT